MGIGDTHKPDTIAFRYLPCSLCILGLSDLFFGHKEHQERQRIQSHIKIVHKNYRTYKGVTQWKMIVVPQPVTKNFKLQTQNSFIPG